MNHKSLSKLLILFLVFQIFACRNNQRALEAREDILRENLKRMREVIDQYFNDNGKYPPTLKELVRRDYLKTIPIDPITRRNDTWILELESEGIRDVHSGADGHAIDGTPYSEL